MGLGLPPCRSLNELLESVRGGTRIDANNHKLPADETRPSLFVPATCSIALPHPEDVRRLLEKSFQVVLIGDSEVRWRHLHRGFTRSLHALSVDRCCSH